MAENGCVVLKEHCPDTCFTSFHIMVLDPIVVEFCVQVNHELEKVAVYFTDLVVHWFPEYFPLLIFILAYP